MVKEVLQGVLDAIVNMIWQHWHFNEELILLLSLLFSSKHQKA